MDSLTTFGYDDLKHLHKAFAGTDFQRNKSTISRHILIYAGKISAKLAKEKADKVYDKFYTVSVWATYALYV